MTRSRILGRALLAAVIGLLLLTARVPDAAAQNPFAAQMQAAADGEALLDDGNLHVFLCGTSGPLFAADRGGLCTAVLAGGQFFVVDAGSRTVDSLARLALPVGRLTGLLITHYHSDHIADIGELNFAHWTRGDGRAPLAIYGPEGIEEVVGGFTEAYALDFGYRVDHHGAEIMPPVGGKAAARPIVFPAGERRTVIYDQEGFRITAFLVDHPPIVPSVGYRFDFGGRSVVISGDTTPSENLVAVAKGADLLVHEVMADSVVKMAAPMLERAGNPRGAQILTDALDNHTFPPDVFAIAARVEVDTVALSHLVPPLPAAQAERVFLQGREAFAGEVVIGEDGMHFVLEVGTDTLRIERAGGGAVALDPSL